MDLKQLGEFGLIGRISESFRAPDGVHGIGDDCAVLPQKTGMDTLVSTDMLVEGTHFLLDDIPAYRLGWKSAAVNISDIAAMGGAPVGSFLAFALPSGISCGWVDEFIRGYKELSDRFGCPLLGGDTTSSEGQLCICVTVLGQSESGKARMRNMAEPGDLICVTGPLGDSAAGLKVILGGKARTADADFLVERHYCPMPKVNEGRRLAECAGVHAMMDISDGIASDLRHILDASVVGAEVDVSQLPMSPEMRRFCASEGLDATALAVEGGEDYELLFTVGADAEASLDVPHTVIGRIVEGGSLEWKGVQRDFIGYRHF